MSKKKPEPGKPFLLYAVASLVFVVAVCIMIASLGQLKYRMNYRRAISVFEKEDFPKAEKLLAECDKSIFSLRAEKHFQGLIKIYSAKTDADLAAIESLLIESAEYSSTAFKSLRQLSMIYLARYHRAPDASAKILALEKGIDYLDRALAMNPVSSQIVDGQQIRGFRISRRAFLELNLAQFNNDKNNSAKWLSNAWADYLRAEFLGDAIPQISMEFEMFLRAQEYQVLADIEKQDAALSE